MLWGIDDVNIDDVNIDEVKNIFWKTNVIYLTDNVKIKSPGESAGITCHSNTCAYF